MMRYTRSKKYLRKPIYLANGVFIQPNPYQDDVQTNRFIKEALWQEGIDQKHIIEPYDRTKIRVNSLIVSYNPRLSTNPRVTISVVVGVDNETGTMGMNPIRDIEIHGSSVRFPSHQEKEHRTLASAGRDDSMPQVKLTIGDKEIIADQSVKAEHRFRGLGGIYVKDSLDENQCLLHIFEDEGDKEGNDDSNNNYDPSPSSRYPLWTKGLRSEIDAIWINRAGNVVHIEQGIKPCFSMPLRGKVSAPTECPMYNPPVRATYLLQATKGFVQKYNIAVGTNICLESLL